MNPHYPSADEYHHKSMNPSYPPSYPGSYPEPTYREPNYPLLEEFYSAAPSPPPQPPYPAPIPSYNDPNLPEAEPGYYEPEPTYPYHHPHDFDDTTDSDYDDLYQV